ncbi:radical SAM protein [Clostridium thermarum]|uniref:radical SAM protein n=1 Tax=Clostridium thermarum TaxID=1716543 RepID=UPI0013D1D396|nr:radical SAM protein [Clostridium thermarum]
MNVKKQIDIKSWIAYDENTDKFSKFLLEAPFSVCYKITQKCNYNCAHCISASSKISSYGLPTEKVKEVFKKIKNAGVLRLDITGGEPYEREDINELLEYAVNIGLEVVITTNGSLLKDEDIRLLSKYKIFTQISIDGSKETNDKLRGEGAFDKAVQAIKKLNNANVPVRINCTIQQRNIEAIDEIVDVARMLNVNNIYIIVACAQGRANRVRESICLNEIEERVLRNKVLQLRSNMDINIKILDFKQYSHSCVLIETNGDFISQSWDENDCINTGNIFESDLKELWIKSNAFDHARHLLQYIRHPVLYV